MKKEHFHKITYVEPGSIAEEMEIEPGDFLISINDQQIEDIFDYRFFIQDTELVVVIRKPDGEEWELDIEKDDDEDLGLEFEQGLMDEYRSCHNKCVFCFIDQMPPGMRETLYFKDDDSRLSFLQGNYVTLTNMSEHDINRIIRYRLEPINVSVHTTNPELRCKMLNNRFAGQALDKIKLLYDAEIIMNGQIVLCKGLNDGDELRRTLNDLLEYAPIMQSVSVVPVGLTKYRDGLYPLEDIDKQVANETIDIIKEVRDKAMSRFGMHFAHASDEFFILAEREMPSEDEYDGYVQLDNGVGMIRIMIDEYEQERVRIEKLIQDGKVNPAEISIHITMATGRLAYPYLKKCTESIVSLFPNVIVDIFPIRNDFFGEKITVAGLITGQDLINQLKEVELGDILVLPECMLRANEKVFLDDVTIEDVEKTLQVKTHIVKSSVQYFTDLILKEKSYE